MALQNCMNLKKDIPGVCSETYPVSYQEGSGSIGIKTEVASDVEQEDDPVPASIPGMKADREVSWIVCVPTVMKMSLSRSVCCPHLHLSVHKKKKSTLANGFRRVISEWFQLFYFAAHFLCYVASTWGGGKNALIRKYRRDEIQ
jgi:hypothetical protein